MLSKKHSWFGKYGYIEITLEVLYKDPSSEIQKDI